jgi:rhodanese-related sulfurtransferase
MRPGRRPSRWSPPALIERVQSGEKIVFLDVRQPEEYAPEHIPER